MSNKHIPTQGASRRGGAAMPLAIGLVIATTITVYAGEKRPNDGCQVDSDCRRGHCYTKQSDGQKVCVDCSSSKISETRALIQRYCKDEQRSCMGNQATVEVAEEFFSRRIETGDRCIAARRDENSSCWDGGDDEHRRAVDEAERARAFCREDLDTRKGNGQLYTCSDSTHGSRAADVANHCSAYGNACDGFSMDERVVDCAELDKSMDKTNKCIESIERLDYDCLPRLSRQRENQFSQAKKAYDTCKQILAYKKDKKLCK